MREGIASIGASIGVLAAFALAACAGSTDHPANTPTSTSTTTSAEAPASRGDEPVRGPGYGGTTSYGQDNSSYGGAATRADGGTGNHDQNGGDIRTDSISR